MGLGRVKHTIIRRPKTDRIIISYTPNSMPIQYGFGEQGARYGAADGHSPALT